MPRYNIREEMYDDGTCWIEDNDSIEINSREDEMIVDEYDPYEYDWQNDDDDYYSIIDRMENDDPIWDD